MTYIPETLRILVFKRAFGCCEYCLLNEEYTIKHHEVDHIYAEKHGGETLEANLCLSCVDCNRYKGTDLASLDPLTREPVFLFHPRRDKWPDHFKLDGAGIEPITPAARATVKLLHINDIDRVGERAALLKLGRYL